MNHCKILLALFAMLFSTVYGQTVGIGNPNPNPNALLEIGESPGNQGLLLPRLKSGTITTLSGSYGVTEQGMLVYDADNDEVQTWDGNSWNTLGGGTDADWQILGGNVVNVSNRVGIGVNFPTARVEISNMTNDTTLKISTNGAVGLYAASGAGDFAGVFHKGDVLINENLGVGITGNPSANLHIKGSFMYEDGNENVGHVLRSDANGEATWVPHDVSFKARASNTFIIPQTAAPTDTKFDEQVFINGPGSLSAEGVYEAGESGYYHISSNIMMKASGGVEVLRMEIRINGTPVTEVYCQCDLVEECTCSISDFITLDAGQVVSIAAFPKNGDRDIQGGSINFSTFSGFLIHSK